MEREGIGIEMCLKIIQIKQDIYESKLWQWRSEFESCLRHILGRILHLFVMATEGRGKR